MGIKIEWGLDNDLTPDKRDKDICGLRDFVPQILRINFRDEKTNSIIFTWVPKMIDRDTMTKAFTLLTEYDRRRIDFVKYIKNNLIGGNKK